MKKVDPENFRRQSEQAAYAHYLKMLKVHRYKEAFPDKITILQDEITLRDPEHYKKWANE